MQDDPVQYWQDLTENYRQMSDGELLELAAHPEDLTDVAQQVLRDEMKLRQLTIAKTTPQKAAVANPSAAIHWEPISYRNSFASDEAEEAKGPHEYTWKVELCDCETRQQALQLAETLRRSGIDSWIQASRTSARALDLTYPRVFVAADQLEQAQAVADQPIPQDIIDQSKVDEDVEPEDFELPKCPKCGAPDAVLENAEPVNRWSCEACGAEWTDAEPSNTQAADGDKPAGS